MVGNIREFVRDAFDYYEELVASSINFSINRYLLEYIANGLMKYDGVEGFIENIDEWIRNVIGVFPELGFDHSTNQIYATIDLVDQIVVVDENLARQLRYVINVQKKYGILIKYTCDSGTQTTTLARFFEVIHRLYPQIKDRYKGLGSSDPSVMSEVVMNPKTRRIYRVTVDDIERAREDMGVLVGKSRQEVLKRKELLLNFDFSAADIDT